jgi:uncharacterized caspase-like protein
MQLRAVFQLFALTVLAELALPTGGEALAAEKRVALVIGNSAYQSTAPLTNPRHDAEDMAAKLTPMGFKVILGLDLDKAGMDRKIAEFAEALSGASVGLFFYGGHGLQAGGQNYLVPTDAKLLTAHALDFEMVRLDLVQRSMERDAKTNIIFLDACRDNPLARNLARALGTRGSDVSRGLAAAEAGIGTMISFSTQPDSVALDGDGRNSPFATALLKHISEDGSISDMLINVRNDVVAATSQQQVPWEHSAMRTKFYFNTPKAAPAGEPAAASGPPSIEQQTELELWSAIGDGKNPALINSYLEQFPNGRFAETARVMANLLRQEQEQAAAAERRRIEAEKASAEKKTATAQEVEALRQAEAAKSEATQALEEARKAREAKDDAERRRAEAEKAAEAARKAADDALAQRQQISTPPANPEVAVANAVPETPEGERVGTAPAREDLARDVQKELKRVGCYDGAVDGKWGDEARAALAEFASRVNLPLPTDEPTQHALDTLGVTKKRTCPETPAATRKSDDEKPPPKRRKQAETSSDNKKPSSSGKSSSGKSGGRDCRPIVGPYGVYDNPWCAKSGF